MPLNQPNRTLSIIQDATKRKYGVLACIAYNIEQLTALVRAAESKRSPLLILLFPATVKQLPTLAFAAKRAIETASVPLALHLDHAQDEAQIRDVAANYPFDSIMVDMSHYDHEENLSRTKVLTKVCQEKGIAVEAESGRINGYEEGIADTGDLEAIMTSPSEVEDFLAAGIDLLAPSIGNIHGDYGPKGPLLDYERLESITKQINGRVSVALHGTNDFTPEIMRRCIDAGAVKLNVNKLLLEVWNVHLRENAATTPLMQLMDEGIDVLQKEVETWMDICGKTASDAPVAGPRASDLNRLCSKSNRDCIYGTSNNAENGRQQSPRHEPRSTPVAERNGSSGSSIDDNSNNNGNLLNLLGSASEAVTADSGLAEQLGGAVDPELQVDNGLSVSEVVDTIEVPVTDTGVSPSGLGFSPIALTHESFLNTSALEWFDLLAQDAITNIQRHNNGSTAAARWNFDESSLSRRPSPEPEAGARRDEGGENLGTSARFQAAAESLLYGPSWNTSEPIPVVGDDLLYFRHYIDVVSPILDLFDAGKHFTHLVPHLATRNIGLLKSILAVAARHASRSATQPSYESREQNFRAEEHGSADSPAGSESFSCKSGRLATQYYYETLQYLSQTLSFQSYADSLEILATAILISAYEMFGSSGPFNNSEWERHLRGAFWIQRCQDNDGESTDGLRRAVWWGWLRQDMFAAFLAGRPVMTFWRPKKSLRELNTDEYATRIVYISAKVVDFANVPSDAIAKDFQKRMVHANKLWEALQSWDALLPASFKPLPVSSKVANEDGGLDSLSSKHSEPSPSVRSQGGDAHSPAAFEPIWIHPSSHAGAMQTYHFARIVLLLHSPTLGGVDAYKSRQRQLDESVKIICGIAINDLQDPSLAFVHVQALYAGKFLSNIDLTETSTNPSL
ncbi:putative fructose-bisphosphate aldolase [Paramyrothecium foliicola]|nr:putative fructose-bisphosphate aldolase [Paramyrothecium foliicola]